LYQSLYYLLLDLAGETWGIDTMDGARPVIRESGVLGSSVPEISWLVSYPNRRSQKPKLNSFSDS
jgi:hypothetical protein